MAASAAQVLRQLEGGWLECRDAQGIYYFNQLTQQTSEAPPGAAFGQMPAAQAPVPAQAAVTKMQLGVWTVAEDAQGEFYYNQRTGQSFDKPPPELLALVQAQQAAPAPAPQYQVQYTTQPSCQAQYAAHPTQQQYAAPPQAYQYAAAPAAAAAPVYQYATAPSAAAQHYAQCPQQQQQQAYAGYAQVKQHYAMGQR